MSRGPVSFGSMILCAALPGVAILAESIWQESGQRGWLYLSGLAAFAFVLMLIVGTDLPGSGP